MLLSLHHRFLFIHVSKAAGTSIQRSLQPWAHDPGLCLVNRLPGRLALRAGALLPYRWRVYREHATATQLRRALPRFVFDECFKFAFVRNPWDWMVSLYSYLKQTPEHRHYRAVRSMRFSEYVSFEISRGSRSQRSFITDPRTGELLVNFVGRFERLHADFASVCATLGLDAALPHANGSSHRDYRDYYDATTRAAVAQYLRADIELFAYSFDTGAEQVLEGCPRECERPDARAAACQPRQRASLPAVASAC